MITGAAGFVGANLVQAFLEEGSEVHAVVRSSPKAWRLAGVVGGIRVHEADIADSTSVDRLFREIQPDGVVHTAVHGARRGQTGFGEMVTTNLIGTATLLAGALDFGVEWFINTGSSSEYGPTTHVSREDDLLEPTTDYGVTKASATMYCSSFAIRTGFRVFTLRLFSPYGQLDDSERLIPYLITSRLRGQIPILSKPESVRDFVFIDDVARAYLSVVRNAQYISPGEVFNVGTSRQHTVADVLAEVEAICGRFPRISWNARDTTDPVGAVTWRADIRKIELATGWVPQLDLKTGLTRTYHWFTENLSLYPRGADTEASASPATARPPKERAP